MHKHHVMPKHLGGPDHPDNLVEVTIEEHAKIHHSLWILGGRWQDEVAWKVLTGQISNDEARRLAVSRALKGKPKSTEHKKKMSDSHLGSRPTKGMLGRHHTNETKQKMRENIPTQFRAGQIPWNKGKKQPGLNWFNNGFINTRSQIQPVGFIPGRKIHE